MAVERISVDLDPVLAQRIRDAAAKRGLSLRQVFETALTAWVDAVAFGEGVRAGTEPQEA